MFDDGHALENGRDLTFGNQLCVALYQCANKVSRIYADVLAPFDLTYLQYQVLLLLWEEDRRSVGSLCTSMDLESNTLTPLLKRLQATGYVRRERDRTDGRRVIVSLTAKGIAFRSHAAALRCHLLKGVGPDIMEVTQLQPLLRKLSTLIDRSPLAADVPPSLGHGLRRSLADAKAVGRHRARDGKAAGSAEAVHGPFPSRSKTGGSARAERAPPRDTGAPAGRFSGR